MIQQKKNGSGARNIDRDSAKREKADSQAVPIFSTQIYSVQHDQGARAQWPAWIWKKLWYVTFAVISVEYISEHHMLL